MVMLAVLSRDDSIFFTPKKAVSWACLSEMKSYLSMFSGAVEFDPYFISHPYCKIEKASTLDVFVYKPTRNALYSENVCW